MGRLYLVATPIGNLEDVSPRALRILAEAHMIACEDTRHTQLLLRRYDIRAKHLTSYNEFNHRRKVAELVGQLGRGWDVALVSDAGTPALSDPGEQLVRAAIDAGHEVIPIPGPSAAIAALVAWLVLGENLAPAQILGGAVVVVAILIAQSLRPTAESV